MLDDIQFWLAKKVAELLILLGGGIIFMALLFAIYMWQSWKCKRG